MFTHRKLKAALALRAPRQFLNAMQSDKWTRRLRLCVALGGLGLLQATTSGYTGCSTSPGVGYAVSGNPVGLSIPLGGVVSDADHAIQVDYFLDPSKATDQNDALWSRFLLTFPNSTPQYLNSDPNHTNPFYNWSANATPIRTASNAWPLGGVLRTRAYALVGTSRASLWAVDKGFTPCAIAALNAGQNWQNVGANCNSQYPDAGQGVSYIVNTENDPVKSASPPAYLTRVNTTGFPTGNTYYNSIGVNQWQQGDLHNFATFKSSFGFGSGDTSAIYYNQGDLGIGRAMHCVNFQSSAAPLYGPGVACYVTNYLGVQNVNIPWGAFGPPGLDATALNDAISNPQRDVATVAMVYRQNPPPTASAPVIFLVYNGSGDYRVDMADTTQKLEPTAKLDNHSSNIDVPTNCVNCHGGSTKVNPNNNQLVSSYFLPFDLDNFKYSTAAGLTRAAQEPKFFALNNMVASTNVPPNVKAQITGEYNNADHHFDSNYVPPGWQFNTSGSHPAPTWAPALYKFAVKPYCRTCHISQTGTRSWDNYDDFKNFDGVFNGKVATVIIDVCGNANAMNAASSEHVMPHSEMTMHNFWTSGARADILAGLQKAGACN